MAARYRACVRSRSRIDGGALSRLRSQPLTQNFEIRIPKLFSVRVDQFPCQISGGNLVGAGFQRFANLVQVFSARFLHRRGKPFDVLGLDDSVTASEAFDTFAS